MSYDITVIVDLPFEDAVSRTVSALQANGFGVLSDLDIRATFATKLGETAADELGDYRILGACNPGLARSALRSEPDIGLLLPCNVVVRRAPGASVTTVQAIDPNVMTRLSTAPAVSVVAADADVRLRRALDQVAGRPQSEATTASA